MSDRPVIKEVEGVEITPEMIRRGTLALASWNRDVDTLEDGAVEIFRAMTAAADLHSVSSQ